MSDLGKPYANFILSGPSIDLVPFTESMVCEDYIRWLNDPKINKFLEVRRSHQNHATVRNFIKNINIDNFKYFWGVMRSDKLLGTAALYLSHTRQSGELGLMIGDTSSWGSGISDEAIDLIAQLSFHYLEIRRLSGGTYPTNMSMNFTFRRLNFKHEGTIRQRLLCDDGTFADEFLWGLLKDEWIMKYKMNLRAK